MRVIDIRPKGIYIMVEFSSEQLQHISDFLEHSKCEFNSEREPEMIKANEYVVDEFYPSLNNILRELTNGT